MRVYAVYEQAGETGRDAEEDVILVKEGFCWPVAFVPLIWLLYHRLWIVSLTVMVLLVGAGMAPVFFRGSEPYAALGLVALSLVFGAEGNNIRQYFLVSSGYSFTGVVVGRNEPDAAMRLFSALGPRIYLP
tara:strand:- start:1856 stop:2248 length:393 start_codon:yes stop_codon:yes gene_type:complete